MFKTCMDHFPWVSAPSPTSMLDKQQYPYCGHCDLAMAEQVFLKEHAHNE